MMIFMTNCQKFEIIKIFLCFWKKSLLLTKTSQKYRFKKIYYYYLK